jgi:DNA-binding NtrC family response regulator
MNMSTTPSKQHVLLVEDHPQLRRVLQRTLKMDGMVVSVAESGDQAKAMLRDGLVVDLVLSDVRMPGETDGVQLARWLQTHHPQVAVLLQSGYSEIDTGEFPILRKPFAPQELQDAIDECLRRIRARV